MCVFLSLWYILKKGIGGSCGGGHTIFNLLRKCQGVSQRYFTFPLTMYVELGSPELQVDSLRSEPAFNGWRCMRVPISPRALQLLLLSSFFFFYSHTQWLWNGVSLWFWFTFPQWLVILSIFFSCMLSIFISFSDICSFESFALKKLISFFIVEL